MSDHPDTPQPPDLDLIERVQRARLQHDQQATPSTAGGVYWIEAKRQADGPAPTSRAGAFVILTTADEVDALWARIKQATEAGALGYKSKVATASRTPQRKDRAVHILTYDADDLADIVRVAQALTALGLQPQAYRRVAE